MDIDDFRSQVEMGFSESHNYFAAYMSTFAANGTGRSWIFTGGRAD